MMVGPWLMSLPRKAIMRATVSMAFVTLLLTVTEAAAGSWCASYRRGIENCSYSSLEQCRAQVLGLGGGCRPNPFPGTAFGTGGTWSSGPRR
jgi:Protein of unknown function (DUF3551)